ncbi:MAG TPA: methyltransferase domain-containing protein [Phycisphaerae bacterium]|nr:methyltransferase domain-containing protein [Phycisphaerae bacterium]
MPFEAWAAFNDLIFQLHRGNVFDDKVIRLEGGGIRFECGQAARWAQFLALVDQEREHLSIDHPATLDAGCWQGTLLCELLQRGHRAGGCDIAGGMEPIIEERVSWLKPEDRGRYLGFRAGPLHEVLPVLEPFDIVCCQETLEHVPTRLLQPTCDALLDATRGTLLTTTPWDDGWSMHLHAFTEQDLRRLLHDDDPGLRVECLVPPAFGNYTTMRVQKL